MQQPTLQFSSERIESALGWHVADLSDFCFRLVVLAEPFVLKNSKTIIVKAVIPSKTGRGRPCPRCKVPLTILPSMVPSKPAKQFLKFASHVLECQWSDVFSEPIPKHILVNAAIVSYQKTKRWADCSNLYQGTEDALEDAGVLTDDVQIGSHDGARRRLDRENPRVEIKLTPYQEIG